MEEQEWWPVNGYEGYYEISKSGKIRGVKRLVVISNGLRTIKSKILNTRINNDGYIDVRLNKDGKSKTTFVHIILANAFIPNPENKAQVNHINGIKTDNRIENLEWASRSENMIHAYKLGLMKSITKCVVDRCNGVEYTSIKEASRISLIPYSTLTGMLNGTRRNTTCLEIAA
jgi:hypothetical protein